MADSDAARVIAFSAHAADAVDLAGGTIAKYAGRGDEVMMVVLSTGARSHVLDAGATLEETRQMKVREVEQACLVLGVQHLRVLNYEDDPLILQRKELTDLVNIIREYRPTLVLTHHPRVDDVIHDHPATGEAVAHAIHCAGRPGFESSFPPHSVSAVYCYWMAPSATLERIAGSSTVRPDVYVDVADTLPLKLKALECFASQRYTAAFNEQRIQFLERHFGFVGGVTYAEPFISLKPLTLDYLPISKKGPSLR